MVENKFDEEYNRLMRVVLEQGEVQTEKRTGQKTLGVTSEFSRFDISEFFPLITTKEVTLRWVAEELFWKLRGERTAHSLYTRGNGVDIWNRNAFQKYLERNQFPLKDKKNTEEWEKEFLAYQEKMKSESFNPSDSDLGPVYGYQLRHWTRPDGKEIDQLEKMLNNLKNNPGGRYGFMSSLNVGEIQDMAIAPCPFHHQFSIYGNNLDSFCSQRSCDIFLGVPYNIAQEALMNLLVAQELGLKPRKLNHAFVNLHAYLGVSPRADFLSDEKNLMEFQDKMKKIKAKEEYLVLRDWYLQNSFPESQGNERKDHVPFMLEQLSKEPSYLPLLSLERGNIFELIEQPSKKIIKLQNYSPNKWDSRAVMAA